MSSEVCNIAIHSQITTQRNWGRLIFHLTLVESDKQALFDFLMQDVCVGGPFTLTD